MLAGRQTRPDPGFEEVGEVALRELGTDVGPVPCFLEEVRCYQPGTPSLLKGIVDGVAVSPTRTRPEATTEP
jgi:hypothetical protein